MNKELASYVERIFLAYKHSTVHTELKEELLYGLEEKYQDFLHDGLSKEAAFQRTIDSIGDISEISTNEFQHKSNVEQMVTNVSFSDRPDSNFSDVGLTGHAFHFSDLKWSDFSHFDLANGSFNVSDLSGATFDHANLTGASFRTCGLNDSSFESCLFKNTVFNRCDMKHISIEDCVIENTEFSSSNLINISFDHQTLRSVSFNQSVLKDVSFSHSLLQDVSFTHVGSMKRVDFNGATMDKRTYAFLKGLFAKKVNLDNVTVI